MANEIVSIEVDTPDTVVEYNKALGDLRNGQKEVSKDLTASQAKEKAIEAEVAAAKEILAQANLKNDEFAKAQAKNKFVASVDKLEAVKEEIEFLKDEQEDLASEEGQLLTRIASLSTVEINPVVMPAKAMEIKGQTAERMISSSEIAE